MFNKVLQILGQVREFYYKKEYQARGAPDYHCLIWIANAPVVGESRSEDITRFIDERVTCNIPSKDTCPELHEIDARYRTSYTSAAITVRKRENLVITKTLVPIWISLPSFRRNGTEKCPTEHESREKDIPP